VNGPPKLWYTLVKRLCCRLDALQERHDELKDELLAKIRLAPT
jgi:hypothetical protein